MSNLPPPPPPPSSGLPLPPGSGPPPPPPPAGAAALGTTFTYYNPVRPAATGVRKATVIVMWVSVIGVALMSVAAFSRRRIVEQYFDGSKDVDDVDRADTLVASLGLLWGALTIAIAILLAVWSHRTASNARARGAPVRPGLAAGGWFIPIGWYWVGFGQLRKSQQRADSNALGWWQGLWILGHIAGNVAGRIVDTDDLFQSQDDLTSDLTTHAVVLGIAAVLLVAASFFATTAMRRLDEDTGA